MAKKLTDLSETEKPAEAVKAAAPVYSVEEFVKAADALLGVSPDIVTAAFRVNRLEEATVAKAKAIVKEFANKEV